MGWNNFKDKKPDIVEKVGDSNDLKISEEVLFLIDGDIYMGTYVYELVDYYGNGHLKELYSIELTDYSFVPLESGVEFISEEEFNEHEIYWHSIDIADIMKDIELLKKGKDS